MTNYICKVTINNYKVTNHICKVTINNCKITINNCEVTINNCKMDFALIYITERLSETAGKKQQKKITPFW